MLFHHHIDVLGGRFAVELLDRDDPSSVGPYRLLARLGQGGMGQVYLGRSRRGELVAVKVVHRAYAGDATFRKRFAREVASARRVRGAFTAAILDSDTEAALPWLAAEYVRGHSLMATVAEHGPLGESMVRTLGCGVALALQSVHAAGVVHRDVKPANVLLAADGPRLVDFGISRATEASTLTAFGQVVGSVGYIAPEQAEGRAVDGKADVFALGAVLVFALTGASPFGEGSTQSMLYRVVHNAPEIPAITDPVLSEVVHRCLAKDPAERPGPAEIAAALEPAPAAGFVPPDWLPGEPPARRRRGLVAAALAVVLLIATAAVYAFGPWSHRQAAIADGASPGAPDASGAVTTAAAGHTLGVVNTSAPGSATGATSAPAAGSTPTVIITTTAPPPRPTPPPTTTDPPAGVATPAIPTNLTATSIDTSTIRLQWSDNSDNEDGFLITDSDSSRQVDANSTAYDWGGLPAGTYVCFAIAAFNAAGYSAYYPTAAPGWICATTQSPPSPTPSPAPASTPAAPSNLSATATSASTIRLQWSDNSTDETGFEIANAVGTVRTVSANTTLYDWTGLTAGTNMCFHIRAYNASGGSAYYPAAATVCATTPGGPPPPLTDLSLAVVSQSEIIVDWFYDANNQLPPANSYTGYEITSSSGTTVTSDSTTAYYRWGGLTLGSTLCVKVRLYSNDGDSPYYPSSGYRCATTHLIATPTGVTAAALNSTTIRIHWTDNFQPNRFETNEAYWVTSTSLESRRSCPTCLNGGTFTQFDWTGLSPGTNYCFYVEVNTDDNHSQNSSTVCATTPP